MRNFQMQERYFENFENAKTVMIKHIDNHRGFEPRDSLMNNVRHPAIDTASINACY